MNCDNFLGDRPSTRVHAPPGGASSISFGGYDAAPKRAAPVRREVKAVTAKPTESKSTAPARPALKEVPATAVAAPATGAKAVSSNVWANGGNQNCGNFISERPTTRLHAPPGGKSSFSLGWN